VAVIEVPLLHRVCGLRPGDVFKLVAVVLKSCPVKNREDGVAISVSRMMFYAVGSICSDLL
jgi:hypothetical protein